MCWNGSREGRERGACKGVWSPCSRRGRRALCAPPLPARHLRGPPGKGLALALALAAGTLLQTLLVNVYFHSIFRLCAHVKCGLIDMLHQKSMRVAVSGQASQGVGGVSNLQSNDAGKLCAGGRDLGGGGLAVSRCLRWGFHTRALHRGPDEPPGSPAPDERGAPRRARSPEGAPARRQWARGRLVGPGTDTPPHPGTCHGHAPCAN